MDIKEIESILKKLKENGIAFKLDGYIASAKNYLRGIYFENSDEGKIKDIIGKPKGTKYEKSLSWYLGDRREKTILRMKKELEIPISDWEKIQTDNYGFQS